MGVLHRLAFGAALGLAGALLPALVAGADPTLWVCMRTEGATGEQADCPAPSLNEVNRFYNSTWEPNGVEIAIAHDSVSATWSVLTGDSSIYAKYGGVVSTGFSNDNNNVSARLDADDFVITGPAGPVAFTLNVVVNGAIHASTNDAQGFQPRAGLNISGNIIPPTGEPCAMTIAGGNVDATSSSGYGVYAAHIGGPAVFTSTPCQVDTGVPFRILIDLGVSASLTGTLPMSGAEGSASARFSASFPSAGPVFNLPVGYSATSLTAEVEDNGYVPEPEAPALAAIALLALAILPRRPTAVST
jgi:hypothetical protein